MTLTRAEAISLHEAAEASVYRVGWDRRALKRATRKLYQAIMAEPLGIAASAAWHRKGREHGT